MKLPVKKRLYLLVWHAKLHPRLETFDRVQHGLIVHALLSKNLENKKTIFYNLSKHFPYGWIFKFSAFSPFL